MSRAELMQISNVTNCMVSETNSKLITGIVQDTMTAIGLITRPRVSLSKAQMQNALNNANLDHKYKSLITRAIDVGVPPNSGLVLFSAILPDNLFLPKFNIKNGIITKGPLNVGKVNGILQYLLTCTHYPNIKKTVADANWRLQKMFNYIINTQGFSLSLKNCTLSPHGQELMRKINDRSKVIASRERPMNETEIDFEGRMTDDLNALRTETIKIVTEDRKTERRVISDSPVHIDYLDTYSYDIYPNFLKTERKVVLKGITEGFSVEMGKEDYILLFNEHEVMSSRLDSYVEIIIRKKRRIEDEEVKSLYYNPEYKYIQVSGVETDLEFYDFIHYVIDGKESVVRLDRLKYVNPFHIMIQAGSKGTYLNLSQSAGMIGQQNFYGGRVPFSHEDNQRVMNTFEVDSKDPRSRGFVTKSYREGYNIEDLIMSFIAGRPGIIAGPVMTSLSGYFEKRTVRIMENARSDFLGSVRDNNGNILQFLYGDDGVDLVNKIIVDNKSTFIDMQSLSDEVKSASYKDTAFIFRIENEQDSYRAKLHLDLFNEMLEEHTGRSLLDQFDVVIHFAMDSIIAMSFLKDNSGYRFIPIFGDTNFDEYERVFYWNRITHVPFYNHIEAHHQRDMLTEYLNMDHVNFGSLVIGGLETTSLQETQNLSELSGVLLDFRKKDTVRFHTERLRWLNYQIEKLF